ncbi:MAG TPA: 4'-phosphopantetheinyl transferase superfamily protein [Thermoleophilaceae bacterium]|jgi:4'-phosphopantetheinyl transferase
MSELGWLSRSSTDVPLGEGWLGPREREVLGQLRIAKRREDWLLGRWTAKLAVAARLATAPERVEVLAAPDGAPEASVDQRPVPLSISLSHRAGRALAVVADSPAVAGCDLELVEPRSHAFIREWLSPEEQALVAASSSRAQLANLLWTAKEAAAKLRREGLRLDVRNAVARPGSPNPVSRDWQPLRVDWDGTQVAGWWRADPGWVMAVAADPAPGRPRLLDDAGRAVA